MKFVIQKDCNPEYERQLTDAILKAGHESILMEYRPLENTPNWYNYGNTEDPNYFLIGSISFVNKGLRQTDWQGFYHKDEYNYNNYSMYFRDKLLNWDAIILPFGEIKYKAKALESLFGSQDLFIRPLSGNKPFAGHVFTPEEIACEQTLYSELCLVNRPIEIHEEYRLIVSDRKVIAQCKYLPEWQACDLSPDLENFIRSLLTFDPVSDKMYVLDLAKTDNDYKVIELNALSTSCWYECRLTSVIEAIVDQIGKTEEISAIRG